MKKSLLRTLSIVGLLTVAFAPASYSAEIITIDSFDPNTFFDGGITAGIDFDVDSSGDAGFQAVTQSGFLSVPATGAKSYNVTHNGITFDIVTRNNNLANQNRWRNNANAGDLMNDFVQFFGDTAGSPVEATVTLTGLQPNTDYELGFFTYNVGAGQTTHTFYEGASSADPLLSTFPTSGNQNTYSTWKPGIIYRINSGSNGEIAVTIQATQNPDNNQSRVTWDGMSVVSLAAPAAPNLTITPNATAGLYDFEWESQEGKVYDLLTSTDLATPIKDWPVYDPDGEGGDDPFGDIASGGTTTTLTGVPGDGPRRFFAVVEKDAPPPPVPALQNASFEDPVKDDGAFTSVAPPNWTEFDAGNLGDVGVWNPLVAEHATVPDGANVGQVYHASGVPMTAYGLSQVLGANFAADTAYQVTVEVGRSASFAWPGYRVELWAGATKIAEEMNTLVPPPDSWTLSTLTYTYSAGDAGLVGQPLEIRLLSLGQDPQSAGSNFSVEFDKVTFTATPTVP